jgi:hypothetical protein
MPNPFAEPGSWLRGNLHCHTTNSDGGLKPQATVDAYAALGYDFLAITDHDRLTDPDQLDGRGMTLIPGVEVSSKGEPPLDTIHLVALGVHKVPRLGHHPTWRAAVWALAEESQVCFVAHPYWSLIEAEQLLELEGHIGVEVYNRVCERLTNHGTSESQWDVLLAHGREVWGLAVDDCHKEADFAGGWIMLKSADKSVGGLLRAVRRGSFYASNGPELRGINLVGEDLRLQCSPCQQAAVIGALPGAGRTTMLEVPTQEAWLRVEVIDENGRKAWSNPFRLDEMEAG